MIVGALEVGGEPRGGTQVDALGRADVLDRAVVQHDHGVGADWNRRPICFSRAFTTGKAE